MGTQSPILGTHNPQFSAQDCCGQTAKWIKMPLGMEVGLGPGDMVLDGDPAPFFGPCLLWPNGRPSQLQLSSCSDWQDHTISMLYLCSGPTSQRSFLRGFVYLCTRMARFSARRSARKNYNVFQSDCVDRFFSFPALLALRPAGNRA